MSNVSSQHVFLVIDSQGNEVARVESGAISTILSASNQTYRLIQVFADGSQQELETVIIIRDGDSLNMLLPDGTQLKWQGFYDTEEGESAKLSVIEFQYQESNVSVSSDLQPQGDLNLIYHHGSQSALQVILQEAGISQMAYENAFEFVHTEDVSGNGMLPMLAVAGSLAGGSGSTGQIISGTITAGPVIAGHGLTVNAYDDNNQLLGTAVVSDSGEFSITLNQIYSGSLLIQVIDTNSNADYDNEAGGTRDLDTDLRAVLVVNTSTTAYDICVNPMTEAAVRMMGLNGGDGGQSSTSLGQLSESQITASNSQVSSIFGLGAQDVVFANPVAIIEIEYASSTVLEKYAGDALAIIAGIEASENISTGQALDLLVDNVTSTGPNSVAITALNDGLTYIQNLSSSPSGIGAGLSSLLSKPTARVTVDDDVLMLGETATVTFTFSEVPNQFSSTSIAVSGGTITNLQQSTSATNVYTATFTPDADVVVTPSIEVIDGGYQNSSGTLGAASPSPTMQADTTGQTEAAAVISAVSSGNTANLTLAEYNAAGINNIGSNLAVVNEMIANRSVDEVNTRLEIQSLVDAVNSVMTMPSGSWAVFRCSITVCVTQKSTVETNLVVSRARRSLVGEIKPSAVFRRIRHSNFSI